MTPESPNAAATSDLEPALIWCPFPDKDCARRIAAQLLHENLIACANILPEVESVFEWQGECSTSSEVPVLFKTTATAIGQAIIRLGELHPYDTPAIVGWKCDTAHPATLQWLGETVLKGSAAS